MNAKPHGPATRADLILLQSSIVQLGEAYIVNSAGIRMLNEILQRHIRQLSEDADRRVATDIIIHALVEHIGVSNSFTDRWITLAATRGAADPVGRVARIIAEFIKKSSQRCETAAPAGAAGGSCMAETAPVKS
jgi:hypothetical protein